MIRHREDAAAHETIETKLATVASSDGTDEWGR
jgi:hypothetical protein